MAVKRYLVTPERVQSIPNQEDNTQCPPAAESEICCSTCWEVQNLNEFSANNTHTDFIPLSPILTRTTVLNDDDEVKCTTPVLIKRLSEELSPVLTHSNINNFSSSPVIGNYSLQKRTKQFASTDDFSLVIEPSSPDNLFSQTSSTSHNISNDENGEQSQSTPIKISQICTQTTVEKPAAIELISSSDDEIKTSNQTFTTSSFDCNSVSTDVNSSTSTVISKKKRYKKNGLAKRLQTCVNYKNSSVAIWLHEQQFAKNQIDIDVVLLLRVCDFWEDCNNFVMHCCYVDKNNFCFVIISIKNANSFVPHKKAIFCLYAPYKTKRIEYNSQVLECYCNISKIKMYETTNE